ncbi:MAG: beta-galactosidase, partial [Anaerolineae bacterium]|nr:beta-galactosidase [Anaerolineae bacterium]
VGDTVIRPHQTPAGSIIALQIANEGIYSNGQHAPWAYDYSPSALALYRQFLQARYETINEYNRRNGTHFPDWASIPGAQHGQSRHQQPYIDWGEFQADYMRQVFDHWSAALESDLPVFINQNPPLSEPFGVDSWLTRVEPERWKNVHYGFTNWVGDVSASPAAFDRYILTAKRTPGINLEENWGFAELYDPAYVDAATSYYQTLAILNAGATGFNVYTGAAAAQRDLNLEVIPRVPYPDAAPITERGEITPKAEIAGWLAHFMVAHGAEFLTSQPVQPAAWGMYLPAARWGAWDWESGSTHGQQLARFQRQMREMRLDYGLLNLQATAVEDWLRFPYLMTSCDGTMQRAVQEKLVDYARRGGKLALVGSLPMMDENAQPCDVLAANAGLFQVFPEVSLSGWLKGVEQSEVETGAVDVWVRLHPTEDVQFVTLLFPTGSPATARVTVPVGERRLRFELTAAPAGGAFLRLEKGRISAAIIKGVNHFRGGYVAPHITLGDQELGSAEPGDFAWFYGWMYFLPAAEPGKSL